MSRVSKMMRIGLVVLAAQMMASVASAQAPKPANDLLLLITERVDGGFNDAQAPTLNYWWAQPAAPNWSPSDKIIHEVLGQKKVGVLAPTGKVQISKIYRRPGLSTANAATLGELVGAKKVLVGTVTYSLAEPIDALGLRRVSAYAELQLMAAESGASPQQRFTVEREVFAALGDDGLTQAREELSRALGTLVAASVSRGAGPVGVQEEERYIGLRNAENAETLQEVVAFLESLDVVKKVSVRWASEGVIALEINPGAVDSSDTIEYAIRALSNQSFERFSLVKNARSRVEGMAEFDVAPAAGTAF